MTDLHTLANAISDSSPNIKAFAQAVADKLEPVTPPPPPPPSGFMKGAAANLIAQGTNAGSYLDGIADLHLTHHRTDWIGGNASGHSQADKDAVADALRARGLKLLPVMITYTDHDALLADIARYGPGGAKYVYDWMEIGNEPNWDGTGPQAYGRDALSAMQAIGTRARKMISIGRGAGSTPVDGWISAMESSAPGVLAAADGYAVHPYCNRYQWFDPTVYTGNWFQFQMFRLLRDQLGQHGQGSKPVFATEFGWQTITKFSDQSAPLATPDDQAHYIKSAYQILRALGLAGGFVYTLNKWNQPTNPDAGFGIINIDGSRTPAYAVVAAA